MQMETTRWFTTGTMLPPIIECYQTPNDTANPSLAVTNANTLLELNYSNYSAAKRCAMRTPIDVHSDVRYPAGASFTKTGVGEF
jgi:hypothetical protein